MSSDTPSLRTTATISDQYIFYTYFLNKYIEMCVGIKCGRRLERW